ncbi:MAG: LuxR C-terminal-related transcriptional regulator [Pseudonocardia sp.]
MLAADAAERPLTELLSDVLEALHGVATFSVAALLLTDTDSMLPFGGVVEGLNPSQCTPFWDNELLDPDFAKFTSLARSAEPVATLSQLTDGDLARSPRYRKLYEPGGGDEIRVAFTTGASCWAVAALVRSAELGPFPAEESQSVLELVPVAARAIRSAVMRRDRATAAPAPTMLVIDSDASLVSATPGAADVLAELATHGVDIDVPTVVMAAARRAKNLKNATGISMRARGSSGRWFRLHAAPLGDNQVAVVVEPAGPADLVSIVLESYGLTQRESEVVPLLARGLSTKEIAAEMCISRHTVNDHIKTIFSKCGVTSRGELVARLFAEHISELHHAATAHR